MNENQSRRDLLRLGAGAALLAGAGAHKAQADTAVPGAKRFLEPFNYAGVRLNDDRVVRRRSQPAGWSRPE